MALCWNMPLSRLDADAAWSPERYSPSRMQHHALAVNSVPISSLITLQKGTFDPARSEDEWGEYIVLDTNHAYEGRIQFRSRPVGIKDAGSVKRPVANGQIIVSRLRTYLRQVALIDHFYPGFNGLIVCSSEFYVLAPRGDDDIGFLVPFLLSPEVQAIFSNAQEGGHHPRMHSNVLMELRVPQQVVDARAELSDQFRRGLSLMREGELLQAAAHARLGELAMQPDDASRHSEQEAAA